MNKLSEYNDMKKLFSNNKIVNNISQYAENNVKNIKNIKNNKNNQKNKNNIINNKREKKKRKNNDNEKINRLADNLNRINNQTFNDVIKL